MPQKSNTQAHESLGALNIIKCRRCNVDHIPTYAKPQILESYGHIDRTDRLHTFTFLQHHSFVRHRYFIFTDLYLSNAVVFHHWSEWILLLLHSS